MKQSIRSLTAIGVALAVNMPMATPAHAYQVDCAILLCLAGGWPASAPCAHARAVFIRRITPWPVEPPLQIWRCPRLHDDSGDGISRLGRSSASGCAKPTSMIGKAYRQKLGLHGQKC